MLHDITRHLTHYMSLFGIIVISLFGLLVFQYDKNFQTAISISAGASYIVWGIIHHHIHEDLNLKIILEYICFSILGIAILTTVIWS